MYTATNQDVLSALQTTFKRLHAVYGQLQILLDELEQFEFIEEEEQLKMEIASVRNDLSKITYNFYVLSHENRSHVVIH